MRYTLPTLFGIVFACAVLTGFVALPSDFQQFITASVLLVVGIGSALYIAFVDRTHESRIVLACAAILLLIAAGVFIASLWS
jgi:hypothetical protein